MPPITRSTPFAAGSGSEVDAPANPLNEATGTAKQPMPPGFNWGVLVRDLLGSPLAAGAAGALQQVQPQLVPPPPPPSHPPSQPPSASPAGKPAVGIFSGIFGGGEEASLRRQLRDYEQRLADMRQLANRQALDISSLRTLAEGQLSQQVAQVAHAARASSESVEERWTQMLQEASTTQERALATGQQQMHELAAALQAAQRQTAEQQAAEWRRALQEASESHQAVVEQMQEQLRASSEEKVALQAMLRDARRASAIAARAAVDKGHGGGGGATAEDLEKAVAAEREAAAERLRTERAKFEEAQAEAAAEQRNLMARYVEATSRLERADELELVVASHKESQERAIAEAVRLQVAECDRRLQQAEEAVQAAEGRVAAMAAARREAINKLQEANGAIRVLCRTRPLSDKERASGDEPCVSTPSQATVCLCAPMPPLGDGARAECSFDACFGSVCTQAQLYDEVSPAVSSVLNGQFVCVMAYGQTGAGKTFTMQGGHGEHGIVHLACDELLREAASLTKEHAAKGEPLEVSFECSLLEIYNEKILDLMTDAGSLEPLDVRTAADGSVSVPCLKLAPVDSAVTVGDLLHAAGNRRHTQ